jgi:hypothetical protein
LPFLLIFGLTKVTQVTPWLAGTANAAMHVPSRTIDRFIWTEDALFVRDLFNANPGTIAQTLEFLGTYSQPTDRLITNYCWEPLYFYTRLPQEIKILPEYHIYDAMR